MTPQRPGARELIGLVLEPGSFVSWDTPPDRDGVSPEYAAELDAAAERSGVDEAVLTGRGLIDGLPVAVVVGEFRFLGGSIGAATAARITAAVRRA
ncbi:carboxyl transferase domain-containing protein, partial [uncultured Arsenicicoccus sp.]